MPVPERFAVSGRLGARILTGMSELDAYARTTDSAFARATDLRLVHDPAFLGALAATRFATNPRFLILDQDGEAVGVVPLLSGAEGGRAIDAVILGVPPRDGVDLADWLLLPPARTRDGFAAVVAAAFAATGADLLHTTRVPARGHLASTLDATAHGGSRTDSGANAWCDVSTTAALGTLSKHQMRNVDRQQRRAEQDFGAVEFVTLDDPASGTAAFDRFLAVEDSGWKGVQGTGTSLLHDAPLREFLRLAMARFGVERRACVNVLTIDGRDAAVQLGFRTGDTWYLQKIGFHPDFRDVGPGAILLKSFLERMAADPSVREVNFMTAPRWADRWHFRSESCHDVVFHGPTWRGRALALADAGKEAARALRDRLTKPPAAPDP